MKQKYYCCSLTQSWTSTPCPSSAPMGPSSTRQSSSATGGEISSLSLRLSLRVSAKYVFCYVTGSLMLLQSSLFPLSLKLVGLVIVMPLSEIKTWNSIACRIRGKAFSNLQIVWAPNNRRTITFKCMRIHSLDWQCWHKFMFGHLSFHTMIWKSPKMCAKTG